MPDIAIIGGGAAGMAAAIACKLQGENTEVVIIEKNGELGKKILATGNGKCNIANANFIHYPQVAEFLENLGILLTEEAEGRVYPNSKEAKDVRELFRFWLEKLGVTVFKDSEVTDVHTRKDGSFELKILSRSSNLQTNANVDVSVSTNADVVAKSLLIATGGKAAPQYGTAAGGYALAKKLGHTVTVLRPALAPIECKGEFDKLKGVRIFSKVTLRNTKTGEEHSELGELQFTEKGISGICVFNLSRNIILKPENGDLKEAFADYRVRIDFMPGCDAQKLEKILKKRFEIFGEAAFSEMLTSMLPKKLANYILEKTLKEVEFIKVKKIASLEEDEKTEIDRFCSLLARKIKFAEFEVCSVGGWRTAQMTAGGVPLSEIDEKTFESKLISNLFFAGEILDYDGICGGYNLAWAFHSGVCAGRRIAECIG